jgi:hypothetical protein
MHNHFARCHRNARVESSTGSLRQGETQGGFLKIGFADTWPMCGISTALKGRAGVQDEGGTGSLRQGKTQGKKRISKI